MISTLWRAQEIRKRPSTRSTTRAAAVTEWRGRPSAQALRHASITHVQFLMCIKWIWMELTKQSLSWTETFWPFSRSWIKTNKQNQAQLFFWLFFLPSDFFLSWVRMSGCPCALNLERMLLLHQITFIYTLGPPPYLFFLIFLPTHLHRQAAITWPPSLACFILSVCMRAWRKWGPNHPWLTREYLLWELLIWHDMSILICTWQRLRGLTGSIGDRLMKFLCHCCCCLLPTSFHILTYCSSTLKQHRGSHHAHLHMWLKTSISKLLVIDNFLWIFA